MDDYIPLVQSNYIPVTRLDDTPISILDDIQSTMSPNALVNRVFMLDTERKNVE